MEEQRPLETIWEIPDDLWEKIQAVLFAADPPKSTGRRRADQRQMLNGIIFRMRSGCQWNHLPKELGSDSTIHRTLQRWVSRSVFVQVWAILMEECDDLGGVQWEWQAADGAMGKARFGGGNGVECSASMTPSCRDQSLCLDKAYDNPTGRQGAAAHGYRLGRGADISLALKMSCPSGAAMCPPSPTPSSAFWDSYLVRAKSISTSVKGLYVLLTSPSLPALCAFTQYPNVDGARDNRRAASGNDSLSSVTSFTASWRNSLVYLP